MQNGGDGAVGDGVQFLGCVADRAPVRVRRFSGAASEPGELLGGDLGMIDTQRFRMPRHD
ncbi:hypothetical protein GCM10027089_49070 [Nocardia thraciensis]